MQDQVSITSQVYKLLNNMEWKEIDHDIKVHNCNS